MIAVLAVDVHAETADAREGITAIARTRLGEILDEPLIAVDDGIGQTLDALAGEDRFGGIRRRHKPPVDFRQRRFAGHEQ